MDRAHQLGYCKQCKLREFSKLEGVICSLTGHKATFEDECPEYQIDQNIAERNREIEEERLQDLKSSDTLGLSMFGIKNQILAGALAIIGSVVWFIAGASADIIFFYPPILFILGLATLIQGVVTSNKRAKLKQKLKENVDLLDK